MTAFRSFVLGVAIGAIGLYLVGPLAVLAAPALLLGWYAYRRDGLAAGATVAIITVVTLGAGLCLALMSTG